MTEDQIAEIQARCDAATPGPWEWDQERGRPVTLADLEEDGYPLTRMSILSIGGGAWRNRIEGRPDDEEFIARAREDVPLLLAEIKRLRALPG